MVWIKRMAMEKYMEVHIAFKEKIRSIPYKSKTLKKEKSTTWNC